jgi:proteasome lid subunit RPN8/RPN11
VKLDVRSVVADQNAAAVPFPQVKQEFRILLAEEAFDAIVSHGAKDPGHEVGGVLVGELLADSSGPYVRVDATIEALHADEKGAELTFTHATWDHVNKEMDSRFAHKRIVGWYHTHPGFGVFLSDRDGFIHRSFFGEPFQIAFVYDPKRREHGVFAWHEDKPRRWRRYAVGEREHSFDGSLEEQHDNEPGESGEGKSAASSASQAEAAMPERTERGDARGWVLFTSILALVFLLGGGALGWWLASRGTALLLEQQQAILQTQAQDMTRQMLAVVGDQLVDGFRAATGDSVIYKGIEAIGGELDKAALALDKGDKEQAKQAFADARAMGVQLKANWNNVHALLARLDEAATVLGNPGRAAKDLARQRAMIGQLFAELAEQAARGKDLDRAGRLFQTAVDAHPEGRERYTRRMQELGLAPPPAPAPAPAAVPPPASPPSSAPKGP